MFRSPPAVDGRRDLLCQAASADLGITLPATIPLQLTLRRSSDRRLRTIGTDPALTNRPDHGTPSGAVVGSATPRARTAAISFLIRGSQAAQGSGAPATASWASTQPRLDRINSAALLRQARVIYFAYLSAAAAPGEPLGMVLSGEGGRVVFDLPVLLPDEVFVPIDWLRGRNLGRPRANRGGPSSRPGT